MGVETTDGALLGGRYVAASLAAAVLAPAPAPAPALLALDTLLYLLAVDDRPLEALALDMEWREGTDTMGASR